MIPPKLSFVLSTSSRASLTAVAAGAGKALGCAFAPHQDNQFDRGEAVAAVVLGLQITLSHDPDVAEGEERLYVLSGWIRDDIDADWDADAPVIDITANILGVLAFADPDGGWFIDRDDAAAAG